MENMKIYIDGKYDIKANLKFQLKVKGPVILKKIDDAWCKLYEI